MQSALWGAWDHKSALWDGMSQIKLQWCDDGPTSVALLAWEWIFFYALAWRMFICKLWEQPPNGGNLAIAWSRLDANREDC